MKRHDTESDDLVQQLEHLVLGIAREEVDAASNVGGILT